MLSADIYEKLLHQLMDGTLLPGQLLNRRDVAASLGTSTAPVLEAMKQLEFDGYLETIPRKGTQVKPISEEAVIGNYILRTGIECMAVRMSAAAGTLEAHREELMRLADKESACRSEFGDAPQSWQADIQYHMALVACCGSDKITEEYRRIALPNIFYRAHFVIPHARNAEAEDHRDLTKRLLAASPDEAEKILRRHIVAGKPKILERLGMQ